eukprot:g1000.t1
MTAVLPEGLENALSLMNAGWLNRYQPPTIGSNKGGADDPEKHAFLLKFERAFASYIGTKYALGVNSGASAIFLAIKCGAVPVGATVLTNAFTFNAVPSAIAHAGCKTVLVECTQTYTIDLDDLEAKIKETGSKCLVLSYMRGRIPDVDAVVALCKKYDVYLIEDAAHAYGCEWKGRKIGSFGRASCHSTQANKLMNSGEGGILLTNDDEIMGKAICSAGCYEDYMLKHKEFCPPMELMLKYRMECINFSLRMTNLQGAILLPQVAVLDERRAKLNENYAFLKKMLEEDARITVPSQLEEVTPVYDSIQFVVEGMSQEELRVYVKKVKDLGGFKLGIFGFMENARNWRTWKFLENLEEHVLPRTDDYISCCCDTRLHLHATKKQLQDMARVIREALASM